MLSVDNVPTGWTAVLRGGGFTIDGVELDGKTATKVTLNVTVPADATGGDHAHRRPRHDLRCVHDVADRHPGRSERSR